MTGFKDFIRRSEQEASLISDIARVMYPVTYDKWTVGITDDLNARRNEQGNPPLWCGWPVGDEAVARAVKKCFVEHGAIAAGDGGAKPLYIYIFATFTAQEMPVPIVWQWKYKRSGLCPRCGGTPGDRRWEWKYINGKMRGVRCQNLLHGPRTIQAGSQCQDHEGNIVEMPD